MNPVTSTIRRYGASTRRAPILRLALIAVAGALALAACQTGSSLAGPTWQWTDGPVTSSAGDPVTADPERYTIEFLLDGTVNVKADCNTLSGTYAVGVPLDLTIDVAVPQADCGSSSLDRDFLAGLARISSYSTDNGELRLYFDEDDEAAMRFRSQAS